MNESAYKAKLKQLRKQESDLLKCYHNIDFAELGEIISLGIGIDMVKGVLSKGSILLTDSGVLGEIAWIDRAALGESDIGMSPDEISKTDTFKFEMTDMVMKTAENIQDIRKCRDPEAKEEMIKKNRREMMQQFNIRVIIFRDRAEVRGTMPTQILETANKEEKDKTAPIITSA